MKVLVLTGHDWALLNYRGPLLRALVAAGHEVCAAAPLETPGVNDHFSTMGIRFIDVPVARAALDPVGDVRTFVSLRRMLARERPDVLLSYAIKSVVYGSLAARRVGVPRIHALIVGLGAAFHTAGIKGALLRRVAVQLYRRACRCCDTVFVQNPEIAELFVRERIAAAGQLRVVPGSGVDTGRFAWEPLPEGPPVFLFVGRLLRDKGVGEFVAAARWVRSRLPEARFVLAGDTDRNPASVTSRQVDEWRREGIVELRGFVPDVRPPLRESTVFVLPSYHEGVPLSALEAMAVGRPILTTDTIGCRETVPDAGPEPSLGAGVRRGGNGFLVPVRAVEPLAAAMERLARDRAMAMSMARQSRLLAETVFDVRRVNRVMLDGMGLGRP